MKKDLNEIKKTVVPILQKFGILRAGIFGSFVRGSATHSSDLDILVKLPQGIGLLDFIRIRHELEDALSLKVDLAEYDALKARLKDAILLEEVRLYG